MKAHFIEGLLRFLAAWCFLMLAPSVAGAELWERELQNMKAAFMTGYFRALQLDAETIAKLKEDEQAMKKYIRAKAREYMEEVRRLNR